MCKNLLKVLVLCGIIGGGLVGIALANRAVGGDAPAIMVSPRTIVLDKVTTVTIHTNIDYGDVDLASIALNGATPTMTKADDCGDLVAKFAVADLDLEPSEAVELTLTGAFEDGEEFSASDMVRVK